MAPRLHLVAPALLGLSALLQLDPALAGSGKPGQDSALAPRPEPTAEAPASDDRTTPAVPTGEPRTEAPADTVSTPRQVPQDEPAAPAQLEAARQHFEFALESYSLGRYRRAILELERARQLDPEGKDLVYNLALVHEKLGELAPALAYFRQYLEMEADADERARIAASIKRVEGALEAQGPPAAPTTAVVRVTESEPVVRLESNPPGLADEWVWATGALAVAAAVAGAVLGARALALNPTRADATASGRSVSDFRSDAHSAHRSAVAADIAFAVAIASGTTAGFLYFGRSSGSEQQLAWSAQVEPARPSTALDVGWRF